MVRSNRRGEECTAWIEACGWSFEGSRVRSVIQSFARSDTKIEPHNRWSFPMGWAERLHPLKVNKRQEKCKQSSEKTYEFSILGTKSHKWKQADVRSTQCSLDSTAQREPCDDANLHKSLEMSSKARVKENTLRMPEAKLQRARKAPVRIADRPHRPWLLAATTALDWSQAGTTKAIPKSLETESSRFAQYAEAFSALGGKAPSGGW